MAESFGYQRIKKCRKDHTCYWCGDKILKGSSYDRWVWVDYPSFDETKVHPECKDAWDRSADDQGGYYEAMPYEHKRGETYEC